MGRFEDAERYYQLALASSADAYTKGAYADFLLDRGRAPEVIKLLQQDQRADPLFLRLTLAYQASHDPGTAAAVVALSARFDAARLRGDVVHRREEARFELLLLNHPAVALRLALANWEVQKEPADARILLEAAHAAGNDAAAEPVRSFCRATGCADQRLAKLL